MATAGLLNYSFVERRFCRVRRGYLRVGVFSVGEESAFVIWAFGDVWGEGRVFVEVVAKGFGGCVFAFFAFGQFSVKFQGQMILPTPLIHSLKRTRQHI